MSRRDDAPVPDTFPAEWLTPSLLEAAVEAAAPVARRPRHGDWRDRVIIYRRQPAESFDLRRGFEQALPSTLIRRIYDATPDDLRSIAAEHRQAVRQLLNDIDALDGLADQLELDTDGARRVQAKRDALAATASEQEDERVDRWREADGEDGVLRWYVVQDRTRRLLYGAGLLTVTAVRDAMRTGALLDVAGIGRARLNQIRDALGEMS